LYELDRSTPEWVMGDVTRLRQILVNLVSNAIKFTAEGEVEVRVRAQALARPPQKSRVSAEEIEDGTRPWFEVQFSVRDTGIGIPQEKLPRLFQSFSQTDSSTTREYGGTGLGLAISKGLTHLMGGEMWVESSPGSGSTFHFRVPFRSATPAETRDLHSPHPQLRGLRILVAERNPAVRALLLRQATSWGLQPCEAPSHAAAVECLRGGERFDLLLVELPGSAADEALWTATELRTLAAKIPLIFLNTFNTRPEQLVPGSQCVGKPIKPQALRAALLHGIGKMAPKARSEAVVSKMDNSLATRLPLRVLVADDNLVNQKVASRLLQQMGYQADVANNGVEVLQALERKPYDVILMDVQMPRMDGLEATRQIRSRQREAAPRPHFSQPILIIAMTANAMHGDREKCVGAGMNDYVPKPVRPEVLQAALEKFPALIASSAEAAGRSATTATPVAFSAGTSQADQSQPVDLDRLIEFSGGISESFAELVGLYLKQTTEQLQEIHSAFSEGASARVAAVAHSCAGASATCGMVALVPLLRRLEQIANEGELTSSAALISAIDEEFARIKRFLDNHPKLLSAA
jgi:CheY-like chemotaxis protein/HPt (histidine-containing phosphotransfer) domain-containing protein